MLETILTSLGIVAASAVIAYFLICAIAYPGDCGGEGDDQEGGS